MKQLINLTTLEKLQKNAVYFVQLKTADGLYKRIS